MVEATGITESSAAGQPLARLYPELAERGLLARLRRVAEGHGVDVLAPALHRYLLPCAPRSRDSRFEHMRQHVTFAPIRDADGVAGVTVTIEDVTERLDRERRLASDLDNEDESVRLSAAKALVAGGESPTLLANSLNDDSWRVRRVAAQGMAEGGREVVDTLIEALREHHRDPALLNSVLTALAHSRADVVMDLISLLEHPDAEVRTYTALALGLVDDSRAVPALLARLADDDVNVRFHSIEALGRIGDRDAANAIAAVAESGDFFLGFAAIDALAAIGESSVASRLLPLLDDDLLVPAVVACLGAIGAEDVAAPLATLAANERAPIVAVASALASIYDRLCREVGSGELVADLARSAMPESAARALIGALDGASDEELRGLIVVLSWLSFDGVDEALARLLRRPPVQSVVADRLATRGIAAAPFLEAVARDGSEDVRRAAAYAFGRIGSPTSVPELLGWLEDDPSAELAAATAAALGAIGDRRAFAPLLALLDHPETTVRQSAVSALNSIGHPQMEAAVAGRLRDDSPRVRESVARIAGYFGYASCLRKMVELCDDADPEVRRAVVEALANYDQRPAWSKIYETVRSDSDSSVRAAAARALGYATNDEALDALVAAARDQNLWVRYFAVRSMSRRGIAHADVLMTLAECATRDFATPVRIAAIEALGTLQASTMLSVVLPLARDPEQEVATAAITTLGYFEVEATAAALIYALNDDDTARQRAALDAIGRQRAEHATGAVRSIARTGPDDEQRRLAIETLAAIGGTRGIGELLSLGADRRMREMVIFSLSRLSADQIPLLQQALDGATPIEREMVVNALGRMAHPGANRAISAALDDPSPAVRQAAARALGRLDLRSTRTSE
jgi:HEAT repeat protein